MSLATPKLIQELQRRLYLKAKQELSQASDGLARRMPLPRAICTDPRSRQSHSGAGEAAQALRLNLIREPDAGKPHVRFDEGVLETGLRSALFGHEGGNSRTQTREGPCESPRQHSTLPNLMVDSTELSASTFWTFMYGAPARTGE